jgi:hypothetical protein
VNINRFASSALLALGMLLVFFGLSAALGFTASGFAASLAVIAALIYAGAVWFAPRIPPAARRLTMPVVFDREGRIVNGLLIGAPLATQFPYAQRGDVARCCAAALAGVPARFTSDSDGRPAVFECLPVRSGDGSVVYGIVVDAEAMAAPVATLA